jgi:hypothetical protein
LWAATKTETTKKLGDGDRGNDQVLYWGSSEKRAACLSHSMERFLSMRARPGTRVDIVYTLLDIDRSPVVWTGTMNLPAVI